MCMISQLIRGMAVLLAATALSACDDNRPLAQKLQEAAPYMCQTFIKQRLRDPDSAEFLTRDDDAKVSVDKDGLYSAVEVVRAANGFGGKTVTAFLCTMTAPSTADGDWYLTEIHSMNGDTGSVD